MRLQRNLCNDVQGYLHYTIGARNHQEVNSHHNFSECLTQVPRYGSPSTRRFLSALLVPPTHGVTDNEAEYQTLIAALTDLGGRIRQARESPSMYSLLLHTDSQLMVGQLTQGWQIKAASLHPLVDEAKSLTEALGR